MPTAKAMFRGGDAWTILGEQWTALWPNLLFLQNYVGTNPAGHTWTLAVEEHFYLLLPFVMATLTALGRIRLLIPICVMSALLFLGLRCLAVWTHDPFAVKMSATHLRLDALLFGVGLRGVAQDFPARFLDARRWRGTLLAVGFLCWSPVFFVEPGTAFIRTFGLTGTYLGSAAFLLAAFHTHARDVGSWAVCLSPVASLLAWIGVYSYSIYLWHVTTMGILEREFAGRILAWAGHSTSLVWTVCVLGVSGGAVLVGMVTSKVIEWPVLRLRDRFFPSRSAPLPGASPKEQGPVWVVGPVQTAQTQEVR
jgi:peptidoglycan/LPS O-acetylase OafA/YrhL